MRPFARIALSALVRRSPGEVHEVFEGEGAAEAPDLGLVNHALEGWGVEERGQVEERSSGRGGGDALGFGDLVARKGDAVEVEERSRVAAWPDDDLDSGARGGSDPPQRRRRAMAEHGSDASGQDRRHPPALRRQRTVTDRVDTRVNGVQPAALEPQLDRTRAGSRLEQLPPGDDAVLPTREVGQKAIEVVRGRFAPVSWGNRTLGRHAPHRRCETSAGGRRNVTAP